MTHPVGWKYGLHSSPWVLVVAFASTLAAQSTPPAQPEAPRPPAARSASSALVTIPEDTPLSVRTNAPIDSRHLREGQPLSFTVSDDVFVGDILAIPRGTMVRGEVARAKKAGTLTGSPELTFKLVSLELGGRSYPVYSYLFQVTGHSKTRPTQQKVAQGAAVGGAIGLASSYKEEQAGDPGANRVILASAGMAAGAGVGTMVSAASSGPAIAFPAETQLEFSLAAPVSVVPVSPAEAARLAQGLHRGGPALYLRGQTP